MTIRVGVLIAIALYAIGSIMAYEKFVIKTIQGEYDEEEKCDICKYHDENEDCLFHSMGSGNPKDMPCYHRGEPYVEYTDFDSEWWNSPYKADKE